MPLQQLPSEESPQSNGGFLSRKNRAGQAWQEIRARLPEYLPLPKGLLIARIVVVFSIVLFAMFSVFAVWELQPQRAQAELESTWHDQVLRSRLRIGDNLAQENDRAILAIEMIYLRDKFRALPRTESKPLRLSDRALAQGILILASLEHDNATKDQLLRLLANLDSFISVVHSDEMLSREQLDRQTNILTFLVAGALVLCCVTLLLMERSNRAKEKVASLRFRATHDPLTHGLNRAAILALAAKELNRAKRVGHPLAIFLIDMDHFKEVNDRYGHPVGDSVIKQAATRLRRNVRVYDAVGRYGGDEFLVVLPDCDHREAEMIAERLRMSFDMPLDLGSTKKKISICVGGAIYRLGETDLEELIVRADESLYKAKAAGRDAWSVMEAPIPRLEDTSEDQELSDEFTAGA